MRVGYTRYKISNLAEGTHFFKFYKDGVEIVTHIAEIKECCGDMILLKYLDSKGMYRFFPFNQHWEKNITGSNIGNVSEFVTSIETSMTSEKSIGKEIETTISATATNVTQEELDVLADLFTSPRVYMYDNSGNDTQKNWIIVQVQNSAPIRRRKNNPQNVNITLKLPQNYAITLF